MTEFGENSALQETMSVPHGFEYLYGDAPINQADLILLGESHLPLHRKRIGAFVRQIAQPGDYILLEAVFMEGHTPESIAQRLEEYGLSDMSQNDIHVGGWENEKAYIEHELIVSKFREQLIDMLKQVIDIKYLATDPKSWWSVLKWRNADLSDTSNEEQVIKRRNDALITNTQATLTQARKEGRKVIVIGGKNHITNEVVKQAFQQRGTLAMRIKDSSRHPIASLRHTLSFR